MGNPQQLRPCVVVGDESLAARAERLIVKCGGVRRAAKTLGIGDSTFDNVRWCGRMQKDTMARILEALDRAEAS